MKFKHIPLSRYVIVSNIKKGGLALYMSTFSDHLKYSIVLRKLLYKATHRN